MALKVWRKGRNRPPEVAERAALRAWEPGAWEPVAVQDDDAARQWLEQATTERLFAGERDRW